MLPCISSLGGVGKSRLRLLFSFSIQEVHQLTKGTGAFFSGVKVFDGEGTGRNLLLANDDDKLATLIACTTDFLADLAGADIGGDFVASFSDV
jgi:hypothetical protein